MSLQRFPDWPRRFEQFLLANHSTPFAYGRWDCCLFVADGVRAMTGADLAAEFRGRYASRREALALSAKQTGRRSTMALARSVFSSFCLLEIAASTAQRGDIVQVSRRCEALLGLMHLDGRRAVVPTERGLWLVPRAECVRGWRV